MGKFFCLWKKDWRRDLCLYTVPPPQSRLQGQGCRPLCQEGTVPTATNTFSKMPAQRGANVVIYQGRWGRCKFSSLNKSTFTFSLALQKCSQSCSSKAWREGLQACVFQKKIVIVTSAEKGCKQVGMNGTKRGFHVLGQKRRFKQPWKWSNVMDLELIWSFAGAKSSPVTVEHFILLIWARKVLEHSSVIFSH